MRWDGVEVVNGKTYLLKWNEEKREYDKVLVAHRFIVELYNNSGEYIGIMDRGRLIAVGRIVYAECNPDCNVCVTVIVQSV